MDDLTDDPHARAPESASDLNSTSDPATSGAARYGRGMDEPLRNIDDRRSTGALPSSAEALVAAWRGLPPFDLAELRREIDEILDPALPLDATR